MLCLVAAHPPSRSCPYVRLELVWHADRDGRNPASVCRGVGCCDAPAGSHDLCAAHRARQLERVRGNEAALCLLAGSLAASHPEWHAAWPEPGTRRRFYQAAAAHLLHAHGRIPVEQAFTRALMDIDAGTEPPVVSVGARP